MSNKRRDKNNKEKDKDEGRVADNIEALTICSSISIMLGIMGILTPITFRPSM